MCVYYILTLQLYKDIVRTTCIITCLVIEY